MSLQNYPTANLPRRLAAMVYDGLILIALYIILGGLLVTAISAAEGTEELVRLSPATAMSFFFSIAFLYYMHSWRKGGQTIGMKSWRLRLINDDGRPVQLSQCMLRSGAGFFSILIVGLGYWWMLFDNRQRTWHDIASVTRVIHMPKDMD